MPTGVDNLSPIVGALALIGGANVEAITADKALTLGSSNIQRLAPDAARNVDLPAEEASQGLVYFIINAAGGAFDLTVRDDAAATVATLNQFDAGLLYCDGASWSLLGVITVALT